MFVKAKSTGDESPNNCCFAGQKNKLKIFKRMTKTPYERMNDDVTEIKYSDKKSKKAVKSKTDEEKENKEVKKERKSNKKTWKLIRQATLTTCRYIGMGVAHMSPASAYGSSDYYIDPKLWNKSFNNNYKNNKPTATPTSSYPHWTSTMMFSSW